MRAGDAELSCGAENTEGREVVRVCGCVLLWVGGGLFVWDQAKGLPL